MFDDNNAGDDDDDDEVDGEQNSEQDKFIIKKRNKKQVYKFKTIFSKAFQNARSSTNCSVIAHKVSTKMFYMSLSWI